MTQPHPILGYPSKSAAAWALREAGKKHDEIAAVLGVNPSSVGNLIRMGRIARGDAGGIHYTDKLSSRQRTRIRMEAEKRGLSVRQLVNDLLAVVADDKLFSALLDTGGDN